MTHAAGGGGRVGRRTVLVALSANLAVAASKFAGFLLTGSSSLLAETLHSAADTGNQVLLLVGARLARETPSPARPFGRGRERYFWAFIVGLVLFGLGGLFALIEGYRKLSSGTHELTSPGVGLALIAAAVAFEFTSLRVAIREANQIRPDGQSWWRFIRGTRNPEVTVVVMEDGAAMVGLGLAMIGVTGTWLTGDGAWDAVTTLAIGALLCIVAGLLTTEMKSLLVGETVTPAQSLALERAVAAVDGVERVLNLRTEHLGPEQVLVCVKISVNAPADLHRVVEVIDAVERSVSEAVPETLTCYVEPDLYDPRRWAVEWT